MISEKYKAGDWEKSKAGISDKVLLPWTPVEVKGKAVKVWGREYKFADNPFPSQINILGEDILVGPITIEIRDEDKAIQFKKNSASLSESSKEKAIFKFYADSNSIHFSGEIEIEYDGMIKISLSLIPQSVREIDVFNIIIPFKKKIASLFHFWPGQSGSSYNSGKVPKEGFKLPFKPFVWLGNEEKGVSWFTETDRNWHNKDKEDVLQITPHNELVELKIKIIDAKFTLDKELNYAFGLQATPVKPFPEDRHKSILLMLGTTGWKNSYGEGREP